MRTFDEFLQEKSELVNEGLLDFLKKKEPVDDPNVTSRLGKFATQAQQSPRTVAAGAERPKPRPKVDKIKTVLNAVQKDPSWNAIMARAELKDPAILQQLAMGNPQATQMFKSFGIQPDEIMALKNALKTGDLEWLTFHTQRTRPLISQQISGQ